MVWSDTFKERAEVLGWLAATLKGQDAAHQTEAAGPTFPELADEWLHGVQTGAVGRRRGKKGTGYSPTTLEGYERSLRYVLTPEFGARPASEINDREWQTWVDRLSREGLSRSRIANHLAVARAIYGWASRPTRRIVERNPLLGIELPPNDEKPRTRVANAHEAAALIGALDPADGVPYALAFYAGLRRAEIKRLDWPDVELDGYRLVIRKAKSQAGTGRRPRIAEPLRPILLGEFMRQGRQESDAVSAVSVTSGKIAERARKRWAAAELAPITLHEYADVFVMPTAARKSSQIGLLAA
jgi:integrase